MEPKSQRIIREQGRSSSLNLPRYPLTDVQSSPEVLRKADSPVKAFNAALNAISSDERVPKNLLPEELYKAIVKGVVKYRYQGDITEEEFLKLVREGKINTTIIPIPIWPYLKKSETVSCERL